MRIHQSGIELDGLPVAGNGLVQFIQTGQKHTDIEMQLGNARIQCQGLAIAADGLLESSLLLR